MKALVLFIRTLLCQLGNLKTIQIYRVQKHSSHLLCTLVGIESNYCEYLRPTSFAFEQISCYKTNFLSMWVVHFEWIQFHCFISRSLRVSEMNKIHLGDSHSIWMFILAFFNLTSCKMLTLSSFSINIKVIYEYSSLSVWWQIYRMEKNTENQTFFDKKNDFLGSG